MDRVAQQPDRVAPHALKRNVRTQIAALALITIALTGCQAFSTNVRGISDTSVVTQGLAEQVYGDAIPSVGPDGQPNAQRPPAELTKISLPTYRIEPPDILLVTAVRMVPKNPYYIKSLDILQIVASGTLPDQPIVGSYQVESGGTVNLGPSYGQVKIDGLTTDEAADAINRQLRKGLGASNVSVSLLQSNGQQQIAGEHLVGPDGTINLGIYGSVYITGMTIDEARRAIEERLEAFMDEPQIALDVLAYNSKVFYIITEGGGFGDQIVRLPITGNETVLDAIAQIGGTTRVSSKKMWISRPAPHGMGCDQVLPIDFDAITRGAVTSTNYQILPQDRIFIAEDRMIALDALVQKLLNPFERMIGFTLLGGQTVQAMQRFPRGSFF